MRASVSVGVELPLRETTKAHTTLHSTKTQSRKSLPALCGPLFRVDRASIAGSAIGPGSAIHAVVQSRSIIPL
jgi:hypothetical protein